MNCDIYVYMYSEKELVNMTFYSYLLQGPMLYIIMDTCLCHIIMSGDSDSEHSIHVYMVMCGGYVLHVVSLETQLHNHSEYLSNKWVKSVLVPDLSQDSYLSITTG